MRWPCCAASVRCGGSSGFLDIDMQRNCPNSGGGGGGELRIIAAILKRPVAEKILSHLGLDPQPSPMSRARETSPPEPRRPSQRHRLSINRDSGRAIRLAEHDPVFCRTASVVVAGTPAGDLMRFKGLSPQVAGNLLEVIQVWPRASAAVPGSAPPLPRISMPPGAGHLPTICLPRRVLPAANPRRQDAFQTDLCKRSERSAEPRKG